MPPGVRTGGPVAKWKVLVGINYRPDGASDEVRAEPGDVVEDLPEKAAKWMEPQGVIVKPNAKPKDGD